MKRDRLDQMSISDLVKRFADITVAQDIASLGGEIAKYNRLYGKMIDVQDELKSRDGDQRIALVELFKHPNWHVRLQAAQLTLAVAPAEARAQLQTIADSDWLPQSADAGMTLWHLDRGDFNPT